MHTDSTMQPAKPALPHRRRLYLFAALKKLHPQYCRAKPVLAGAM